MKAFALWLSGVLSVVTFSLHGAEAPRGNLLELHSCAVYAGGCVVSSQDTLGGRYLLRAWQFTGGAFAQTEFAGLEVALLEVSAENLATPEGKPREAVVYLPQAATAEQRQALLGWLKSQEADFKGCPLQTRVVPLSLARTQDGWTLSAGNGVAVQAGLPEVCPTGSCGESLWYEPRSSSTLFSVALNRGSQISEPLLKLHWTDFGKQSIFLARFDGEATATRQYVGAATLCGLNGNSGFAATETPPAE